MDERGIEPRAFPMRRERDTPTPHTRNTTFLSGKNSLNERANSES